ncbi:hypothetical protein BASA81_007395 [Batrachochytrium salamandrivorans]|nr:hypothetical protein BASA81_007395 [Batrachochytrium salamandrivorans]
MLWVMAMAGWAIASARATAVPDGFNLNDFRAFRALSESLDRPSWKDCNSTQTTNPCSVCGSATQNAILCEVFEYNVTVNATSSPTGSLRRQLAVTQEPRQETRIVGLRLGNLGISGRVPVLALASFGFVREIDLSSDRTQPFVNTLLPPPESGLGQCVLLARCYNSRASCNFGPLVDVCLPEALAMPPGTLAGVIIGGTLGGLLLVLVMTLLCKSRYFKSTTEELAQRKLAQEKKNRSISQKQRKAMEKERLRQERHQKKLALARTKAQNGGAEIVSSKPLRSAQSKQISDVASVHSAHTQGTKKPMLSETKTIASFRSSKTKKSRGNKSIKDEGGRKLEKKKSVYSSMRTRVNKPESAGEGINPWTERMDQNGTKYWINLSTGVASTTPPRDAFSKQPTYQEQLLQREGGSSNSGLRSLRGGGALRQQQPRQPASHDYDDLDEPNYYGGAPGGFGGGGGGFSQNPMFQGTVDPRTGQFMYQ